MCTLCLIEYLSCAIYKIFCHIFTPYINPRNLISFLVFMPYRISLSYATNPSTKMSSIYVVNCRTHGTEISTSRYCVSIFENLKHTILFFLLYLAILNSSMKYVAVLNNQRE